MIKQLGSFLKLNEDNQPSQWLHFEFELDHNMKLLDVTLHTSAYVSSDNENSTWQHRSLIKETKPQENEIFYIWDPQTHITTAYVSAEGKFYQVPKIAGGVVSRVDEPIFTQDDITWKLNKERKRASDYAVDIQQYRRPLGDIKLQNPPAPPLAPQVSQSSVVIASPKQESFPIYQAQECLNPAYCHCILSPAPIAELQEGHINVWKDDNKHWHYQMLFLGAVISGKYDAQVDKDTIASLEKINPGQMLSKNIEPTYTNMFYTLNRPIIKLNRHQQNLIAAALSTDWPLTDVFTKEQQKQICLAIINKSRLDGEAGNEADQFRRLLVSSSLAALAGPSEKFYPEKAGAPGFDTTIADIWQYAYYLLGTAAFSLGHHELITFSPPPSDSHVKTNQRENLLTQQLIYSGLSNLSDDLYHLVLNFSEQGVSGLNAEQLSQYKRLLSSLIGCTEAQNYVEQGTILEAGADLLASIAAQNHMSIEDTKARLEKECMKVIEAITEAQLMSILEKSLLNQRIRENIDPNHLPLNNLEEALGAVLNTPVLTLDFKKLSRFLLNPTLRNNALILNSLRFAGIITKFKTASDLQNILAIPQHYNDEAARNFKITICMEALSRTDIYIQLCAVKELYKLSQHAGHFKPYEEDVIQALGKLLDDEIRHCAQLTLARLAIIIPEKEAAISQLTRDLPLKIALLKAIEMIKSDEACDESNYLAINTLNSNYNWKAHQRDEEVEDEIKDSGVVDFLVRLLKDNSSQEIKQSVLKFLLRIIDVPEHQDALRNTTEAIIPALIHLLKNAEEIFQYDRKKTRVTIVEILSQLALSSKTVQNAIRNENGIEPIFTLLDDVQDYGNGNPGMEIKVIKAICNLIYNNHANQDAVINGEHGIRVLMNHLNITLEYSQQAYDGCIEAIIETLQILATKDNRHFNLIDINHFVSLLLPGNRYSSDATLIKVIKLLGAISINNTANQDAIRDSNGIAPLIKILDNILNNSAINIDTYSLGFVFFHLAINNIKNQNVIRDLQGIPSLAALLKDSRSDNASKEVVLRTLRILIHPDSDKANKIIIGEKGIIELIVATLNDVNLSQATKTEAAYILGTVCVNGVEVYPIIQNVIRETGGIAALVTLLTHTNLSHDLKRDVVAALGNNAYNNTVNQNAIRDAQGIPALVALLKTTINGQPKEKDEVVFRAVLALKNIVDGNVINQNAIRDAQGIPDLIALLDSESTTLKIKAQVITVLYAVATENTANQNAIADGISSLIRLLGSTQDDDIKFRVYNLLTNLANNNPLNQNIIREQYGIMPLIAVLKTPNISAPATHFVVTLLRALAYKNTANQDAIYAADGIPLLLELYRNPATEKTKFHSLRALINLLENEKCRKSIPDIDFRTELNEFLKSSADNHLRGLGEKALAILTELEQSKASSFKERLAQQKTDQQTENIDINTPNNLGSRPN